MSDRFMEQMKMITRDADNEVILTATATIKPYEHRVIINSAAGAMTVTMPPVAECGGQFYSLYVLTYTGAITIAAGDSVDFTAPTFDTAADGALFYSDGERWWILGART